MMPYRALIVDDEPLAHTVIAGYCAKLSYLEVIGSCYDAISTLAYLEINLPDVLFLDIQMPDLTGLELLGQLRRQGPKVVLTTAHTEFALDAFDYDQVIDYLHKPITLAKFLRATERLRRQLQLEQSLSTTSVVKPAIIIPLTLRTDQGDVTVQSDTIEYLQSYGNYVKLFVRDCKPLLARATIKDLYRALSAGSFLRVHKSYVVNLTRITHIRTHTLQLDQHRVPVGRSYRVQVAERLRDLFPLKS